VRFCPWYPLVDAAYHAPAGEGVLQVRLASGLVDYPRGKSAMVHYEHAGDVRAAALAFGERHRSLALVARHLIEVEHDSGGVAWPVIYAKVLGEFERRFGAPPQLAPP
jgi:hypothetical protein